VGNATHPGERYTTERPHEISVDDRWEAVRKGAYDPDAAIEDMAIEGVEGAVIFPTKGVGGIWMTPDPELLNAICRTYNDWAAEFCNPYPDALKGAAMINLDDIAEGVAELTRAKKLGLSAAIITVHPAHERQYFMHDYDPFWAAAQEMDIPLCLHSGSNRTTRDGIPMDHYTSDDPYEPLDLVYPNGDHWIRRSLSAMIMSGVFERFPRLKVASVENQAGWAGHWLFRMDLRYHDRKTSWGRFKSDMGPSDFFHRNIVVSFQDDRTAVTTRNLIGVDNLVWGSDYPHTECTWPESQRVIRDIFSDASEEEIHKITFANTARFFGFQN
jgi:predicted TIM-barrel fold metal-dependent hydrolase